jgi:hypothetical protein
MINKKYTSDKAIELTKRELFAAMAMQGYLSNPDQGYREDSDMAKMSISAADALIEELNK